MGMVLHGNSFSIHTYTQPFEIWVLTDIPKSLLQMPMPTYRAGCARGLNFGLSLHLHTFFVYASREGSGKTAYMRRSEPSLLPDAMSTQILCASPYIAWY